MSNVEMSVSGRTVVTAPQPMAVLSESEPSRLIFSSVHGNDVGALKRLLEEDQTLVHAKDAVERTPLHIASFRGYTDIARTLLEFGADFRIRDRWGLNPISYAEIADRHDMIELLTWYSSHDTCGDVGRWFVDCMTACGKGCDGCLQGFMDCCATLKKGVVHCWTHSRISDRFKDARKKLDLPFITERFMCYITSLALWVTGCVIGIHSYQWHCIHDHLDCGRTARGFLMFGLLAPTVADFFFFMCFLIQICITPIADMPIGGPMMVRDNLFWNTVIPLFSIFISASVALFTPRWVGTAYITGGLFVVASGLSEIAITLSPRTGLVGISAAIGATFSAMIAFDDTIEDHELAIGAFVLACVLITISGFLHTVIARALTPTPPIDQLDIEAGTRRSHTE